jgi:hypothetical protein
MFLPGKYRIVAHQEGFTDSTFPITVASSGSVVGDIEMNISAINEEVTVTGSGTGAKLRSNLLQRSVTSIPQTSFHARP